MESVLDIEKIDPALSSLEDTEKAVIEGSDEHLDIILIVQNALSKNTVETQLLVNYIESNFNNYTAKTAQELIAKVFPYFDLAKKIKEAVKESGISMDVKSHLAEFETEVNELFEITNDLSKHKVRSSDDYNTLFND